MHHPLRQSNFPCYFVSIAILCMIFSAVTLDLYRQPTTKESHIPESAEVFASAIELKIPNFTQPQATTEATQEDTAYLYDNISFAPELQELLWCACKETGCPYELALSVIWCETRFRNVNGDGGNSIGYMQIQPKWHKARMERLGVADLSDPLSNFRVGCDFLAELIDRYGNEEMALTCYNTGSPGKSSYATRVIEYMTETFRSDGR